MKIFQCVSLLLLAVILSGCSNYPVEGRYSYDTRIDYASMKSFTLLPVNDSAFSTPESTQYYREAIVQALKQKGFQENNENPDFGIETRDIDGYVEKVVMIDAGQFVFPKALLRVNLVDLSADKHSHIYEAVADGHFDENMSQQDKNALIDEAVRVLLSGFPPTQK